MKNLIKFLHRRSFATNNFDKKNVLSLEQKIPFQKNRGFTLVECVIAIAVFGIAAMLVATLISGAIMVKNKNNRLAIELNAQTQLIAQGGIYAQSVTTHELSLPDRFIYHHNSDYSSYYGVSPITEGIEAGILNEQQKTVPTNSEIRVVNAASAVGGASGGKTRIYYLDKLENNDSVNQAITGRISYIDFDTTAYEAKLIEQYLLGTMNSSKKVTNTFGEPGDDYQNQRQLDKLNSLDSKIAASIGGTIEYPWFNDASNPDSIYDAVDGVTEAGIYTEAPVSLSTGAWSVKFNFTNINPEAVARPYLVLAALPGTYNTEDLLDGTSFIGSTGSNGISAHSVVSTNSTGSAEYVYIRFTGFENITPDPVTGLINANITISFRVGSGPSVSSWFSASTGASNAYSYHHTGYISEP